MKQRIASLKNGERVDSYFSVKYKKPAKEYRYGWMFELRLADASGELTAKYWGQSDQPAVKKVYESFGTGDVVRLTGEVKEFGGSLEIGISQQADDKLEALQKGKYEITELIGRSPVDADKMMAELLALVKTVSEPHLQALLRSLFDDRVWAEKLKEAPASMMMHSNYLGGLLEHTLKVAMVCDSLASYYPELDRDLLVTGAILHDVGKIRELEVTSNIDVSEEGMLRGHVVITEEMVNARIAALKGFPELLKLKLDHLILSHHGKKEWGAPKEPQTPEAFVLHIADMLDAQVFQYLRARAEANTDDPWIWDKRLGHVYLK